MFGRSLIAQECRLRQECRRTPIDVWLNPPPRASVSELAHELAGDVHVVVVPKTGSRRADIAVLTDPDPAELERVARLLPGTPVVAATSSAPTPALRDAARRSGAHLVTQPTAGELLHEIHELCDSPPKRHLTVSA